MTYTPELTQKQVDQELSAGRPATMRLLQSKEARIVEALISDGAVAPSDLDL